MLKNVRGCEWEHEADEAKRTEFVWFVFCMIGVELVEG